MPDNEKALIIVDVQVDFCPGGALPVPDGDSVVPVLKEFIALFSGKKYPVIASRDWHPAGSEHFKAQGGEWPEHCVRDTRGAAFHWDLDLPSDVIVISKGVEASSDGYSVFEGKDERGRAFAELLEDEGVKELYIGGLATDFCVKATALDAVRKGFRVFLLTDATAGISPGGVDTAVAEMSRENVTMTDLKSVKEGI